MLIAVSIVAALRSGIFNSAIFFTCFFETLPILLRFGSPDPFSSFAAFRSRTAAGGVFVINVNDLSLKTVITDRYNEPLLFFVRALNCLQNSIILTPFWPSAGPTGARDLPLRRNL